MSAAHRSHLGNDTPPHVCNLGSYAITLQKKAASPEPAPCCKKPAVQQGNPPGSCREAPNTRLSPVGRRAPDGGGHLPHAAQPPEVSEQLLLFMRTGK